MPPRSRKTRGRAAPSANESSDSEPEHQKQRQSPQREESDDEGASASAANNNDDAANEEEDSPAPNDRTSSSYNSSNDPGDNTLRILLSTDNHLGYLEKDPIRGMDSFAALEEVLSVARLHKVDLVLLSGDLFHDNKPSRRTLHTTMEILRRYCMGGESVKV